MRLWCNLRFLESEDYSSLDDEKESEPSVSLGEIKVDMQGLRQDLKGKFIDLIGNPESQESRRQSKQPS